MSEETAADAATAAPEAGPGVSKEDLDQAIGKIRTYYAQNVIARVQEAPGDITPTHEYHDTPGGIPIPSSRIFPQAERWG